MVSAALKRRPNVRFCRHQSRSHNGLEPRIRDGECTRPAKPCGFAAALGRRGRVAHNSTGPTSVSICFMKQKKELRLNRRTTEATEAREVTQRTTSRSEPQVRRCAVLPRLPNNHNNH